MLIQSTTRTHYCIKYNLVWSWDKLSIILKYFLFQRYTCRTCVFIQHRRHWITIKQVYPYMDVLFCWVMLDRTASYQWGGKTVFFPSTSVIFLHTTTHHRFLNVWFGLLNISYFPFSWEMTLLLSSFPWLESFYFTELSLWKYHSFFSLYDSHGLFYRHATTTNKLGGFFWTWLCLLTKGLEQLKIQFKSIE